jgi:hypothetical protein
MSSLDFAASFSSRDPGVDHAGECSIANDWHLRWRIRAASLLGASLLNQKAIVSSAVAFPHQKLR